MFGQASANGMGFIDVKIKRQVQSTSLTVDSCFYNITVSTLDKRSRRWECVAFDSVNCSNTFRFEFQEFKGGVNCRGSVNI